MFVRKALEEKAAMTPETGYNLVGLDDFGLPEDQGLYLIGNFATEGEANREMARRKEENPSGKYFVYGPRGT